MSHESIVDQQIKCTQNLPFEVIAVPQYDDSQLVNGTANNLTDTVNVKIRVRNREEISKKHGIISVPKSSANSGRKLRLIKSDQTIMSFDFYVDPNATKKQQKKSHKNIFHIFKPGGCLKTEDENDDEYHYSPSFFRDVSNTGPTSLTDDKTNMISEKITLKKNFPLLTANNRTTKRAGNFMGKCKPGGCLDPPFNEDKYSYEPGTASSNASVNNKIDANKDTLIRNTTIDSLNTISDIKINIQGISENIVRTQFHNNVYQENYSHSLITYPTTSIDNLQIHKQSYDMKLKKRISSEDKARISINEFSEIFFMPPKNDRAKKLQKEPSENFLDIEKKNMHDNKNSEDSLINHAQLESPTPIIDTASFSNKDVLESNLNIVSQKRYYINETNADLEVSNNRRHTLEDVKSPELIQTVEIPLLKSHNMEYIGQNIISNKTSKVSLMDSDETEKFILDNKKTYSQKDIACNKSATNTKIKIKEIEELISKYPQQLLKKESVETCQINEINASSLKDTDIQNINANNIIDHIAAPAIQTKDEENSLRLSQESFKIGCKEIAYVDKIKVKSLKSEEMQNVDFDYVVGVSKHSKPSIKESQEIIAKKCEETTKTDEIKTSVSKSEDTIYINDIDVNSKPKTIVQAMESKCSLDKSQGTLIKGAVKNVDRNAVKKIFITNNNGQNLETNTNTKAMSEGQDNRYYENHLEPDNMSFSEINGPFERQKSMDIANRKEENYATTNLNLDNNNNITDIYMISDDSSLNKSVTITPTEPFSLKTSDVNFSTISLIEDKTNETNFHEDKTVDTVEKLKYLSESLGITSAFGPEKNIEVDSNKDLNHFINSKTSMVHKISELIVDQVTDLKNTSSITSIIIENINDKLKSNFDTTHDYNDVVTKKLQLIDSEILNENPIKRPLSIDRVEYINYIDQPSNEHGLDICSYSSVAIDFGFWCSITNENKLVIHSFDSSIPSYKDIKTKVSVIKSLIRVNGDQIRIPINSDIDLSIQIKKAKGTSKDIISKKKSTPEQHLTERSGDKIINKDYLLQETLNSVYENLIPLNKIIQTLKEEANTLSRQQNSFKEILETMEIKPKRLIHTDPRCWCERK